MKPFEIITYLFLAAFLTAMWLVVIWIGMELWKAWP